MCPSDTYKVYKQGSNVRIDTTLLGFDQSSWVRGNRSYVFSGHEKGADLLEIDHDSKTVYCEEMKILSLEELESYSQSDEQISARLTTPLVLTYLDTEKINFERSKSGFWGWGGSDKVENVSGYECKVFGANNVELVTKSRTEHMTEEDKKRSKSRQNPLQSFLGFAEVEESVSSKSNGSSSSSSSSVTTSSMTCNPCSITEDEYFSSEPLKDGRDIGRPKEMSSKIQKFKAQLWLSEDYPLSLQEQIMPIVDLMAISNAHFQKLKDFITCSFPQGFPVKIEIPLFHVLNARITFGNIFGIDSSVPGITVIEEESESRLTAVVDDSVFAIPSNYAKIGGRSSESRRRINQDDDDQLLQYALSASMNNTPTNNGNNNTTTNNHVGGDDDDDEEVDIYEALQAPQPRISSEDRLLDIQIQRAIEASLGSSALPPPPPPTSSSSSTTTTTTTQQSLNGDQVLGAPDDIALAIALSEKEHENQSKREKEEQEMLEKILKLSMEEK